jgi:uncharacterized protein YbjT (DUF2867 family)
MSPRSGPVTLVVGATGALGGVIARRLLAEGRSVRVLVRPGAAYQELEHEGAIVVVGDLRQPNTLAVACDGVDSVITTATAAGRTDGDFESVDIRGTRALIDAAVSAAVKQFVFTSVAGARPDAPVALARAKAASERALRDSGLAYTVLQPAAFMETWIGYALGAQLLETPGRVRVGLDVDAPLSLVTLESVAELAVAVLQRAEARNRVIPLMPADRVSYRAIVSDIANVTGHPIEISVASDGAVIPPLPPAMGELWQLLREQGLQRSPELDVAREFGVRLGTVREFAQRTFGVGA